MGQGSPLASRSLCNTVMRAIGTVYELRRGTRVWQVIRLARRDIPELKQRAAALATARSAHYAGLYGLSHGAIAIRAPKRQWGSCSSRGNLCFNYKIAALPAHLADYIVAHEICHLREMNHSPRFWALVAHTHPAYTELRRELRATLITFR